MLINIVYKLVFEVYQNIFHHQKEIQYNSIIWQCLTKLLTVKVVQC